MSVYQVEVMTLARIWTDCGPSFETHTDAVLWALRLENMWNVQTRVTIRKVIH